MRQFLVGWIVVLDSVPSIDLVAHLPAFLDGLFSFLSESSRDIIAITNSVLNDFLGEIRKGGEGVEWGKMMPILIKASASIGTKKGKNGLIWEEGERVNMEYE